MHAHDLESQHQEVKPGQKGAKGSKGKGKAGMDEGEDGKVRRTRQSREYWSGASAKLTATTWENTEMCMS